MIVPRALDTYRASSDPGLTPECRCNPLMNQIVAQSGSVLQEFGVMSELPAGGFSISDLQRRIFELYGAKDEARGDSATFLWLAEEFGELATALRSGTPEELALEMADVLAWLATLANIRGVDLEAAVWRKYGEVCPGCRSSPCRCDPSEKP